MANAESHSMDTAIWRAETGRNDQTFGACRTCGDILVPKSRKQAMLWLCMRGRGVMPECTNCWAGKRKRVAAAKEAILERRAIKEVCGKATTLA